MLSCLDSQAAFKWLFQIVPRRNDQHSFSLRSFLNVHISRKHGIMMGPNKFAELESAFTFSPFTFIHIFQIVFQLQTSSGDNLC